MWTTHRRLAASGAQSVEDIRALGHPVIAFSDGLWTDLKEIRAFLFGHMYRAPQVMAEREKVTGVVMDLFPLFLAQPRLMPDRWQTALTQAADETTLARLVCDYIAGMTDRFALQEHVRLQGEGLLPPG